MLILIIFTIAVAGCKKNRIIDHPEFESNLLITSSYGIDRIELTDSTTIVDVTIYNQPGYWVAISPSVKLKGRKTGRDYRLKWMEGIAPDIMVHVDSTGYYSAKLIFEPIMASDSLVDLIDEEEFKFKGIKLYDDSKGKIKTKLSGTLKSMGASWLLVKKHEHEKEGKEYKIPVRDGKFDYDIFTDEPLVFTVLIGKEVLENSVEKIPVFWSEGGEIKLNFIDGSSKNFTIEGGELTKESYDFNARIDSLRNLYINSIPEISRYTSLKKNQKFYIPEFYSLKDSLKKAVEGWKRRKFIMSLYELQSSDSMITPAGKEAIRIMSEYMDIHQDSLDAIEKEFLDKELSKPTMAALFYIYNDVSSSNSDVDINLERFNKFYLDTFTNSSYHKYIKELAGLIAPIPGNHIVNVSLPDKKGKTLSLSELIEGKRCLLIICNDVLPKEKLEELKSIYNKYQDDNFEIVCIIIEEEKPDKESLAKISSLPWPLLYDKNGKVGVGRKYQLGNDRYKTFLINESGFINSVNPSQKEIENYLK